MTLQRGEQEVGVRELHDKLSEYLQRVEAGTDVIVTRRGRRVARLSAIDADDPFEDLKRRGLLIPARRPRTPRKAEVHASGSVSELITEERG
jgi:prevent-host-death family protein